MIQLEERFISIFKACSSIYHIKLVLHRYILYIFATIFHGAPDAQSTNKVKRVKHCPFVHKIKSTTTTEMALSHNDFSQTMFSFQLNMTF